MRKFYLLAILALSINAFAQIPTNGLVGYWPFNGNANDESGNGHNGTVTGSVLTTDRHGTNNGAYYFDGNNDYIYITNSSLVTGNYVSISLWVYTNGPVDGFPIISGNQNEYNIYIHNDSVIVWIMTNTPTPPSPNTSFWTDNGFLPYNQWDHIVLNYDGSNLKMYVNNILSQSIPATGQIWSPQADYLAFGKYFLNGSPSGTQSYKGKLDDVRIYNRGLNETEISALYNEGLCYQTITVTDTLIINANFTGFNPVTYANTIKIYPNPTYDHITIDFGSNYSTMNGYTLKITNSLSQIVYTTPVTQQQTTVNLSTWTGKGIYFVHLIDAQSNTIDIRKIVLQ